MGTHARARQAHSEVQQTPVKRQCDWCNHVCRRWAAFVDGYQAHKLFFVIFKKECEKAAGEAPLYRLLPLLYGLIA